MDDHRCNVLSTNTLRNINNSASSDSIFKRQPSFSIFSACSKIYWMPWLFQTMREKSWHYQWKCRIRNGDWAHPKLRGNENTHKFLFLFDESNGCSIFWTFFICSTKSWFQRSRTNSLLQRTFVRYNFKCSAPCHSTSFQCGIPQVQNAKKKEIILEYQNKSTSTWVPHLLQLTTTGTVYYPVPGLYIYKKCTKKNSIWINLTLFIIIHFYKLRTLSPE